MDLFAHLTHLRSLSIIEYAVAKNELDILQKVLHIIILMLLQFFLDCAEIHWVFYNVEVIVDAKLLRLNWLLEDPGLWILCQNLHHPCANFLPMVVYRSILVDLGNFHLLDFILVNKILCDIWLLSFEKIEFCVRDWPVFSIVQNLKNKLLWYPLLVHSWTHWCWLWTRFWSWLRCTSLRKLGSSLDEHVDELRFVVSICKVYKSLAPHIGYIDIAA